MHKVCMIRQTPVQFNSKRKKKILLGLDLIFSFSCLKWSNYISLSGWPGTQRNLSFCLPVFVSQVYAPPYLTFYFVFVLVLSLFLSLLGAYHVRHIHHFVKIQFQLFLNVHHMCPSALTGQIYKYILIYMELELQAVSNILDMGAGNRTQVLWENSKCPILDFNNEIICLYTDLIFLMIVCKLKLDPYYFLQSISEF